MKKTLKAYRKIKQLSQQELADKSGVSIRTIQRIEKNISTGSPYVIKALCKALEIEIEDIELVDIRLKTHDNHSPKEVGNVEIRCENDNDKQKLKRINLSAVLVLLFPLLNLLVPSILYWIFKKSLNNRSDALKVLSYQALWTFITLVIVVFSGALSRFLGIGEISGYPLPIWIYLLSVVLTILITIDTAIRINKSAKILTFIPTIL